MKQTTVTHHMNDKTAMFQFLSDQALFSSIMHWVPLWITFQLFMKNIKCNFVFHNDDKLSTWRGIGFTMARPTLPLWIQHMKHSCTSMHTTLWTRLLYAKTHTKNKVSDHPYNYCTCIVICWCRDQEKGLTWLCCTYDGLKSILFIVWTGLLLLS